MDSENISKINNEDSPDNSDFENKKEKHNINNNNNLDLIYACKYENSQKIKQLIENGANLNMKNEYRDSPLTILCEKVNSESLEIIKNLVEKGIDINASSSTGSSALNILCRKNSEYSFPIIDYLIKKGADIINRDENGMIPLLTACYFNNETLLLHLIKTHKVDVNIYNNNKDSPLIISSYFNNEKIIKDLIDNNANLHFINKDGDTFRNISKKYKNKKIDILLKKINNGKLIKKIVF